MIRRSRRPSLLGTAARTAVVAGTATAVSGNVQAKQAAAAQQKAEADAARAAAQQAATPPASASPDADPIARLERLAALRQQGLLTDEEFTAAKASLLGL